METADVIVVGSGQGGKPLAESVHIHPTYGEALPSLARLLVGDITLNFCQSIRG
jgi:hypothetical protein